MNSSIAAHRRCARPVLGAALAVALSACDGVPTGEGPSEVFARSEVVVARRPGAVAGPFVVQVMGPAISGVPGRNGRRDPVPDVDVTFEVKGLENRLRVFGERVSSRDAGNVGELTPEEDDDALGVSFLPVDGSGDAEPGMSWATKTDSRGYASAMLRLPLLAGDFRVRAEIRNQKQQKRSVDFVVISGMEVLESQAEGPPRGPLEVTVQVWRVEDAPDLAVERPADGSDNAGGVTSEDGDEEDEDDSRQDVTELEARLGKRVVADEGRRVFFSVINAARGSGAPVLEDEDDKTNSSGIATLRMRLGDRSGTSRVLAELEPRIGRTPIFRGVIIERHALSAWELGLALAGGVVLFVVGLRLLGSGLLILLSPSLNLVVGAFRRSRVLGFLGGIAAGALFHSSSALVSHLIAFANAGLVAAGSATAQIAGANVGKTFLLQLLAFRAFGLLAVPLTAIGTVLFLLPGRLGFRTWGGLFLGGGLTLLGWQFLGESAELVDVSPALREALSAWDPWGASRGVLSDTMVFAIDALAAALLAMLLRNSNLVVALGIVFASMGLLSFPILVPVIVGANLGSAAALALRALTRSREARRLAVGQLLFQTIGAVWLVLITVVTVRGQPLSASLAEWVTPGVLFHTQPENVAHHAAMLYTLFHLINGVVTVAASGAVHRLTDRLIPRDPTREDVKPFRLDPSLVNVPSLALAQATREVCYLGEVARKGIAEAFDAFRYLDANLTDQIARRGESVSNMHALITRYLLDVSENSLSSAEASRLEGLHVAAASFARTGELSENLCHMTTRILEEQIEVPEDLLRELTELYELIINQFENVLHLLDSRDPRIQENAMKIGEKLSKSSSRIENLWLQRARPEIDSAPESAVIVLLTRQVYEILEQVAGHLTHTAERIRILSKR